MGNFFRHPFILVVSFFALVFLYSRIGPNFPISILSQQKGEPLVVSGEGKVSVVPDIAKVNFGIQESGPRLSAVQNSVNIKSKTLTDQFKKLGIGDKDIKTTSYNVFPQYDYNAGTPRITGYQVSVNYEVTIRNFDIVNDILVAGTQNGANIVGGINFEINDDTKKQKLQEAREKAVSEAKEKAEGLAKAAGISLGKIINVSENQAIPLPRPLAVPISGGGETKVTEPSVQPGETEISVSVSLSYEIR